MLNVVTEKKATEKPAVFCPHCQAQYRYEYLEAMGLKKRFEVSCCDCETLERKRQEQAAIIEAEIKSAKIPEKYRQPITDFQRLPELEPMWALVMKYLEGLKQNIKNGIGFGLFGPVGIGKSWLAHHVLLKAIEHGYTVRSISFRKYVQSIDMDKEYLIEVEENIERQSIKLLLLDDLRTDKLPDWKLSYVSMLFEQLYLSGKAVGFTGNFGGATMAAALGDDVVSRIIGMCNKANIVRIDKAADMRGNRELTK